MGFVEKRRTLGSAGTRRGLLTGLAWLGLSSLLGVGVPAQDDGELFSEAIDVRVVNVDAIVTDRKGRFVDGLSKDDFILEVDGVVREISHFLVVNESAARVSDEEPDEVSEMPASTEPDPMHLVFYLDHLHLQPAHANRVLEDLRKFGEAQAERGVRVMLVTYDTGAKVRLRFTNSPQAVGAGFEALEEDASSLGLRSLVAHRSALRGIEGLYLANECPPGSAFCPCSDPCECAWSQMLSLRDQYAGQVSAWHAGFRSGLSEIVGSLGGITGRKALLYISSGLEQYPGLDLLQYMSDLCPDYESKFKATSTYFDTNAALTDLTAGANANRVALYALSASGLEATSLASVDHADRRFRPSGEVDTIRRTNLESSLVTLAYETGGRAILNSNQPYDALDELSADFTRYYSLAFEPSGPGDGGVHLIRVKLSDKPRGLAVRHRRSYRDKPAEERQAERTLTALHFGVEDNPHGATLRVGAAVAMDKKHFRVPVAITLPVSSLPPLDRGNTASVHVTLTAQDLISGRTDLRGKRLEIPALEDGQSAYRVVVELELTPGSYRFAAGIRDEKRGVASYLSLEASVP